MMPFMCNLCNRTVVEEAVSIPTCRHMFHGDCLYESLTQLIRRREENEPDFVRGNMTFQCPICNATCRQIELLFDVEPIDNSPQETEIKQKIHTAVLKEQRRQKELLMLERAESKRQIEKMAARYDAWTVRQIQEQRKLDESFRETQIKAAVEKALEEQREEFEKFRKEDYFGREKLIEAAVEQALRKQMKQVMRYKEEIAAKDSEIERLKLALNEKQRKGDCSIKKRKLDNLEDNKSKEKPSKI